MIQFVTEPSIYITGILQPNVAEIDRFFADRGQDGKAIPRDAGPETCVVLGSRTCYESYDRGREHAAHCANLIESQHGSCLEHAVFQVMMTGISRSCGRQLLRHRHLSPSESSQRYCDKSEVRFVVPPDDLADYKVWSTSTGSEALGSDEWHAFYRFVDFRNLCSSSLDSYRFKLTTKNLTKKKKEAARARLLEAAETTITFTGNVRAYRNLFERRCTKAADAEIRRVSCLLFTKMKPFVPNLLADYTQTELPDGTFALSTPYRAA